MEAWPPPLLRSVRIIFSINVPLWESRPWAWGCRSNYILGRHVEWTNSAMTALCPVSRHERFSQAPSCVRIFQIGEAACCSLLKERYLAFLFQKPGSLAEYGSASHALSKLPGSPSVFHDALRHANFMPRRNQNHASLWFTADFAWIPPFSPWTGQKTTLTSSCTCEG